MKTTFLISIVLAFFYTNVQAQNEPIQELFSAYIKDVNDLYDTNDPSKIESYFLPEFKANETYVGLESKIRRRTINLEEFLVGFRGLASDESIDANVSIDDINYVSQGKSQGTISATLSLDLKIKEKTIEKSIFSVTMVALKSDNDNWRFIHSDQIQTIEERTSGNCLCYFYERKGSYATQLFYPNGIDYQSVFNDFRIVETGSERKIVTGNREFSWAPIGKIVSIENDTEVGASQDTEEAIILILNELYKEQCTNIYPK